MAAGGTWPDPPAPAPRRWRRQEGPSPGASRRNQSLDPLISEFRAPDCERMNLSLTTWSVTRRRATVGNGHRRKRALVPATSCRQRSVGFHCLISKAPSSRATVCLTTAGPQARALGQAVNGKPGPPAPLAAPPGLPLGRREACRSPGATAAFPSGAADTVLSSQKLCRGQTLPCPLTLSGHTGGLW